VDQEPEKQVKAGVMGAICYQNAINLYALGARPNRGDRPAFARGIERLRMGSCNSLVRELYMKSY
jgi:hypothetical protein